MKVVYGLLSLLVAGLILNSCSELTSAEKYGDDIYAEVTIDFGVVKLTNSRVKTYVGEIINFNATKDVVPAATELTEKWSVEPASIAEVDENGTVEIMNLGKADLIVGLYDKKNNLVASDTLFLYAEAKKTLELGGPIQSFTKIGDEEGIFLGGSESVGLYNSRDYGNSWNPVQIPVSNSVVRNIARSPVNPGHLVATYREFGQCCDIETYTGVLISKDNGQSWVKVSHPYINNSGYIFYEFSDVAFAPDDSETLYILSRINSDDRGMRLYKSTDFGINWQTLKTFNWSSSTLPTLFVDRQHTIVVATAGSVNGEKGFVSTDYGSTWVEWPKGVTETLYHMDDNGGLYARTFEGNSTYTPQQIVYSGDKGQSWEVILEHDSYGFDDIDTYAINNVAVIVNTGYSGGFLIKISNNRGSTWKEFQPNLNSSNRRPNDIKILQANEERMELLLFFGKSSFSNEAHVWKMMVYFDSM